jgi:transposase
VNDRRILNGIFWVLRSGPPWRDLPEAFGPYTTCYNRFVRWRFFNRIKQCRRFATRYDKLAANYLAFVQLASIRVWLRVDESTPRHVTDAARVRLRGA